MLLSIILLLSILLLTFSQIGQTVQRPSPPMPDTDTDTDTDPIQIGRILPERFNPSVERIMNTRPKSSLVRYHANAYMKLSTIR